MLIEDLEIAPFLSSQPKRLFIGGKWVEAASGKAFPSYDPSSGKVIAEVAEADAEDIDRAVKAARKAFDERIWLDYAPVTRSTILWRIADIIERRSMEFAQVVSLDSGKPIAEALLTDVMLSVATFRHFAGYADKVLGQTLPVAALPGSWLNYTLREPVGVVGAITAWNFPLMFCAWKLAPALACGCSVVLKPAEQTPLPALLLMEAMEEAEVPAGLVNLVPGPGETAGVALVAHPQVDKISFTGSTPIGKQIVRAAASDLKRVSLELGGKSPNIVFADADLSRAASGAYFGIFTNQGESCVAGSRLFVQTKVYDQMVGELSSLADSIRLGPGLDPLTQMGPVVSEEQLQRVLGYIEAGRSEGAHLVAGGERADGELKDGYFVRPTVFAQVDNRMKIAQEEIFGPVLAAIPFEDEAELIAKANDTIYGLGAGVWTSDVKRAHRVAHALKAGMVWVNCYHLADPGSPWGGVKQSGWGRELGPQALDLYTEVKNVWLDLS